MAETKEAFFEQGIGALNALRLFAHNVRLDATTFLASVEGDGPTQREVIQYRASQSWGDIIRNRDGITIKVIANVGLAPDFVSRTLHFRRSEWTSSKIMNATTGEFLADGGRAYSHMFAQLFDLHQRNSKLHTFEHAGEMHFFVQSDDQGKAPDLIRDLEHMAQGLDASMNGQGFTITSHPAFDMPGHAIIIDEKNNILKPSNKMLDRLNQMNEAAKALSPTLRMTRTSTAYPMTFTIYPHKFTLESTGDPNIARARALAASARVSVNQGADDIMGRFITTLHIPTDTLPKDGGADEAVAAAVSIFNQDWDDTMVGDPRPEILISSAVQQTIFKDSAEIEIIIRADTDAARRYNESGRYELRPK